MATHLADLPLLWRLGRYGLRYPGVWLLLIASTLVMAASSGYLVLIIENALELIGRADTDHSSNLDDMRSLGLRTLALVPVAALAYFAAWLSGQWLANRCMLDLRDDFLGHLIELELAYHTSITRGDLITRMTSDLDAMQDLFRRLFGKALQRPAEALGTIGFLFYLDWRFASLLFLAIAPGVLIVMRTLRRTSKRSRKARERLAENITALEQITSGIKTIKAMGSMTAEKARYAAANHNLFQANLRVARSRAHTDAVVGGLTFGLIGVVLIGGSVAIERSLISGTVLLTFLTALGRLTNLVRTGAKSYGEIQEHMPAAIRLFEIIDRPSRIRNAVNARLASAPRDAIRLQDVRFRHGDDSEVLRGVNIDIPAGKAVAIVGESGAGKSTLLDLLPRFHEVTGGAITIDGVDIRELDLDSLAGLFAMVHQDSFLFDDTIENNIRYGRVSSTREEIEAAAKRAHVHETILGLEGGKGYDTVVGNRGERLSGGQRQRIAIARAILRNAPILLLDEPTSALDVDSEHHVLDALAELMRGRTTIMVSHRPSMIERADIVYVLDRQTGTIVESGSPQELVAQGGSYARLLRMHALG